ncbi:MAG TPA: tetratricopeptide repeat protein [Anaerolineae bacterium]|nr:tetratricopeptide repeat protein [Anaerolineae bacterium]
MDKARDRMTPQRPKTPGLALAALLAVLLLTGCGNSANQTPTAAPAPQLSAQEYFDQGNALYEQGDLQAAANAFREAVALDDQNPGYWHNLGVTYYSLNALDEATESFERGLALAPDDAELNYLMGVVAIQLEQLSEAETYLTRANQMDPALPEPYFGLGVLYRLQGQREQAIAAFETFLKIGPGKDPAAIPVAEGELEALRAGQ